MTLATRLPRLRLWGQERKSESRLFRVAHDSQVLGRCRWRPEGQAAPALVLVHGFTGSASSSYMRGLAAKAFAAGFHAVRLNMRACGGTEALSPSIYHAGLTGDLYAVARELNQVDGLERICFAGFSLGGNSVLRLFGELGSGAPPWLLGGACISPALDLERSVERLDCDPAMSRYRQHFLANLKRLLKAKARAWPRVFDLRQLAQVRGVRDFDELFTAPLSGHGTAAHYYASTSARFVAQQIARPLLLISARDDLFVPWDDFGRPQFAHNPWITCLLPERGGHCAFIAKRPVRGPRGLDPDCFWAENRALDWLLELCEQLPSAPQVAL